MSADVDNAMRADVLRVVVAMFIDDEPRSVCIQGLDACYREEVKRAVWMATVRVISRCLYD